MTLNLREACARAFRSMQWFGRVNNNKNTKQMTTKTSQYNVGDRVTVRPGKEHDGMGKGEVGTIKEISTPALGVKFPSMSEVHKWYADEEVKPA